MTVVDACIVERVRDMLQVELTKSIDDNNSNNVRYFKYLLASDDVDVQRAYDFIIALDDVNLFIARDCDHDELEYAIACCIRNLTKKFRSLVQAEIEKFRSLVQAKIDVRVNQKEINENLTLLLHTDKEIQSACHEALTVVDLEYYYNENLDLEFAIALFHSHDRI